MFVFLFVFVNTTGLAVICLFFVCLFVFVNTTGLVERCLCLSLFVCVCQHSWLGTEMFIFVCLFVCVCQHRWLGREMGTSST